MIRFELQPEPVRFAADVARPGQAWLAAKAADGKRPPPYWNEVRVELCEAFRGLCAYSAMHLPAHSGQVDHFVSGAEDRGRLYDWSNYRFAAGSINSSKKDLRAHQLLDPFEVQDDWFEVILPSLELRVTAACPEEARARALTMLRRLRLGDDRQILHTRRNWLSQFEDGHLTFPGLMRNAPLLARALQRRIEQEVAATQESAALLQALRQGEMTFPALCRTHEALALRLLGRVALAPI